MIRIQAGSVEVRAELNQSRTAAALLASLPLKAEASTWGDEIYFEVPFHMEIENGKRVVEMGDVAYWPDGPSLCLFFGRTPASRSDEIRPASAVSVVGRIVGDPKILKSVRPGEAITVDKLQTG